MQASLPELEALAGLPTRAFPSGQTLFDPARTCLGFPLVGKGSVKVFKAFPNGREVLLCRLMNDAAVRRFVLAQFTRRLSDRCHRHGGRAELHRNGALADRAVSRRPGAFDLRHEHLRPARVN